MACYSRCLSMHFMGMTNYSVKNSSIEHSRISANIFSFFDPTSLDPLKYLSMVVFSSPILSASSGRVIPRFFLIRFRPEYTAFLRSPIDTLLLLLVKQCNDSPLIAKRTESTRIYVPLLTGAKNRENTVLSHSFIIKIFIKIFFLLLINLIFISSSIKKTQRITLLHNASFADKKLLDQIAVSGFWCSLFSFLLFIFS